MCISILYLGQFYNNHHRFHRVHNNVNIHVSVSRGTPRTVQIKSHQAQKYSYFKISSKDLHANYAEKLV